MRFGPIVSVGRFSMPTGSATSLPPFFGFCHHIIIDYNNKVSKNKIGHENQYNVNFVGVNLPLILDLFVEMCDGNEGWGNGQEPGN